MRIDAHTYELLAAMPTLAVGQADDLKIDDTEQKTRVWTSRVIDRAVDVEIFDPATGMWSPGHRAHLHEALTRAGLPVRYVR